jgi:2-dehydropantoate 2-reductase
MKLMVTGLGGVGGYIASILCANYATVTVIARNERKVSIAQKGLVLHSDFFGEHIFHPVVTDTPADAGIQDIIFVCVKNYSLVQALQALLPCVDTHTIIVPVLNGVDHGEITRQTLTTGHVVDSTIYITSAYDADYAICQSGAFARIYIGSDEKSCVEKVYSVLQHPGLNCHIAPDIHVELWNKYITNCAYNVITAYYECNIGDIFESSVKDEQFRTLLIEAYHVGLALGIHLSDTLVDDIYTRVHRQDNRAVTSSLARDIIHHHQSELETFSGYLVRTAQRIGIDVPFSRQCYQEISARLIAASH